MTGRPRYLPGPKARRVEQLLNLERYSLRAIERRANGDYALVFHTQRVGDSDTGRPRKGAEVRRLSDLGLRHEFVRALRLTENRVERVKPTTLAKHLRWRLGLVLTVDETCELRWLLFAFALRDELRRAGIGFERVNGRRAA